MQLSAQLVPSVVCASTLSCLSDSVSSPVAGLDAQDAFNEFVNDFALARK
jgi:hypothetical protein